MDDRFDTVNFVGAGVDNRLYDGLLYSHSAGHCHYRCADQNHSGAKSRLNDLLNGPRLPRTKRLSSRPHPGTRKGQGQPDRRQRFTRGARQ